MFRLSMIAAFLLAVASPSTAGPPKGFVLTLKMPSISGNRPCGGMCGLRWGDAVQASLTLHNQSKRARTVAIELSCSGLDATLLFIGPRGRAKAMPAPHRLSLSNKRACRKNVPRFVKLAAGAKLSRKFRFKVPRLRGVKQQVLLQLELRLPRARGSQTLRSAQVDRLVHR